VKSVGHGSVPLCVSLCALMLSACGDRDPDFDEPGPEADPFALLEEDGLPVLHLWTTDDSSEDAYSPARLVYRGREYRGVQAKYRGETSLAYPKKSFTVRLAAGDPFDEPAHGLRARRRIVLTTTFDDNSYVRQRLAFELWHRLQPSISVQSYHAVLYLNGRYHGLYLVGDHVDGELMAAHGLWPEGNLYKARDHDANLRLEDRRGDPKEPLELGYSKEEGKPQAGEPGAFDDLHALIRWAASAPDGELAVQLDDTIERGDFEAWLMLVSAIDAMDSAGKNSYLYHDPRPAAPDPRWRCVPWDFNASFGQDWQTWRLSSQRKLARYDGENALFERFTSIPELAQPLKQRVRDALAASWSRAEVLALFDAYSEEIAAAALRDEHRWGARMRDYDWGARKDPFTTHDEERAYVRQWIEERWELIGEQN
jgi:spore coat protein H